MGTVDKERKRRQYRSGSVMQRKDGMWIGRFEAGVDADGERIRPTVSAKTEARCIEKLEAKKIEIARMGLPTKVSGRTATVASWAAEWLEMIVDDLRPKAYSTTASMVKVWIVPAIGRKQLTKLTPADIRSVFAVMRKAGKAPATRIRAHTDIMSMLKAAMLEGHDVAQRCLMVKRPKPGETDREDIPLPEAIALLKVSMTEKDCSKWITALVNGVRQGERLGLLWDLIDFENNLIDISWQLQPLPYLDPMNKALGFRVPDNYIAVHLVEAMHLVRPKSKKSRRVIPMVPMVRAALLAWKAIAPPNPHGLVWAQENGKPIRAEQDRAEWNALQDAADVRHPSGRRYVQHETRHTTATVLLELGVDKDVVAAILGQSDFVTNYDHAKRMQQQREALEMMSEQLQLVA